MECPSCHATLMTEDVYCRHCGTENPYFTKHREDVKEFTEELQETHQNVLKKVTRTNRFSTNICIVCLLLVLNFLAMVNLAGASSYAEFYKIWQSNQNEAQHRTTIQAYAEAGDVLAMAEYLEKQIVPYHDALSDYTKVYKAAIAYRTIYQNIAYLNGLSQGDYDIDTSCELISDALYSFYDAITLKSSSNALFYTEEHMASFAMMEAKLELLLESYLNIPPEDIPALLKLSDFQRAIAIREEVTRNET